MKPSEWFEKREITILKVFNNLKGKYKEPSLADLLEETQDFARICCDRVYPFPKAFGTQDDKRKDS